MLLLPEQAKQLATQMATLYVSERDRFLIMADGKITMPKIKKRNMYLADSNIKKHLQQEYAISVYGVQEGSRFLCFDVDAGGLDTVRELVTAIESTGIDRKDIHISFSGSKGYHVELFFDDLVSHACLLMYFKTALSAVMFSDTSKIECRPTAKMAIKLPLSKHHKTEKMCWYLDQETLREIPSHDYLFGIEPMDALSFQELTYALVSEMPVADTAWRDVWREYETKGGGIVSGDSLPKIKEPGTRHSLTVRLTVALRWQGLPIEACREVLYHWMSLQDASLYNASNREVYRDINEILRWAYSSPNIIPYACENPMASVTRKGMRQALMRRGKAERKLFFLLLFNRRYRKPLRQDDIAEMVGITLKSTQRAITTLAKAGEITINYGHINRTSNGLYCKRRSRYDVVSKSQPGKHEAAWNTDISFHTFPLPQTAEELRDAYFGTIHAMFGHCDLQRNMVGLEYKDYLCWLEARNNLAQEEDNSNGISQTGNP